MGAGDDEIDRIGDAQGAGNPYPNLNARPVQHTNEVDCELWDYNFRCTAIHAPGDICKARVNEPKGGDPISVAPVAPITVTGRGSANQEMAARSQVKLNEIFSIHIDLYADDPMLLRDRLRAKPEVSGRAVLGLVEDCLTRIDAFQSEINRLLSMQAKPILMRKADVHSDVLMAADDRNPRPNPPPEQRFDMDGNPFKWKGEPKLRADQPKTAAPVERDHLPPQPRETYRTSITVGGPR